MYIVLPTTIGADSCPLDTPVENVKASLRLAALPTLISSSELNRVLA